jgi:hypothetical protein
LAAHALFYFSLLGPQQQAVQAAHTLFCFPPLESKQLVFQAAHALLLSLFW